jgi:hypothetical protein
MRCWYRWPRDDLCFQTVCGRIVDRLQWHAFYLLELFIESVELL